MAPYLRFLNLEPGRDAQRNSSNRLPQKHKRDGQDDYWVHPGRSTGVGTSFGAPVRHQHRHDCNVPENTEERDLRMPGARCEQCTRYTSSAENAVNRSTCRADPFPES